MTPAESAELRALAMAATPGPWERQLQGINEGWVMECDVWENQAYIAACSPGRILALLDERDGMEKVIEAAKAYCDAPNAPTQEALDDALAALEEGK